jgi:hypothetical protein
MATDATPVATKDGDANASQDDANETQGVLDDFRAVLGRLLENQGAMADPVIRKWRHDFRLIAHDFDLGEKLTPSHLKGDEKSPGKEAAANAGQGSNVEQRAESIKRSK